MKKMPKTEIPTLMPDISETDGWILFGPCELLIKESRITKYQKSRKFD